MADGYKRRLTGTGNSLLSPEYLVYKFLIPDLENAISKYSAGKVLDVGCGNKPYESKFPTSVTDYVGCDVEQSSLKVVDVLCPATQLSFENNAFDTVFCTQVLEHVYDHKKAVFEIARVLKPGGFFIGSVPMAWPHHEEPYDFFRFTKYGLEGLIKEAGLEVEYIKANGGKWALLGQFIILSFLEQSQNPRILTRIKRILFRLTLSKVWINFIFGRLDKISSQPAYHHTLNFVFVAKKPQ